MTTATSSIEAEPVHERANSALGLPRTSNDRKSSSCSGIERDAAEHLVELVRRNAAARRLHDDVLGRQHVAARQVARHDEALAHLDDRRLLALVDLLDAVADRLVGALEVAHHLAQPDRLERERVVGALHRAVQREVLLDDAGAEDVGGHRHRDAVVVAREPDDRAGKPFAVRGDDAQVELLERRRIAGRALQDARAAG